MSRARTEGRGRLQQKGAMEREKMLGKRVTEGEGMSQQGKKGRKRKEEV
jgi:peptidoglycan hydrolase-like amidase